MLTLPYMARKRVRPTAATVHDVAKVASVSAITVSRALNSPGQLSPATLARVRAAIAKTGYIPNLLAGGLRSAKSRLVAAVVPTVAGPVFLETIQSLTDVLDQSGYQLRDGKLYFFESDNKEQTYSERELDVAAFIEQHAATTEKPEAEVVAYLRALRAP